MPDTQIVKITWLDAEHENDFQDADTIRQKGLAELETVGYLVSENDERLKVAMEYWPNEGRWRNITTIPVSLITKRCVLRERSATKRSKP